MSRRGNALVPAIIFAFFTFFLLGTGFAIGNRMAHNAHPVAFEQAADRLEQCIVYTLNAHAAMDSVAAWIHRADFPGELPEFLTEPDR